MIVPTVERGLREVDFWSIETAGRQPLDEVDVGLVHLAEELAGVGRQRLDVAALALGEDRVERERGLARPGQAGEDDQAVPREVEGDVLEVVLAGAADDQLVLRGGRPAAAAGAAAGRGEDRGATASMLGAPTDNASWVRSRHGRRRRRRAGRRPRPDPARRRRGLRRGVGLLAAVTDALLDDVRALDDDAVPEPSLLPGWTRGHVLAHVARNAEALSQPAAPGRAPARDPDVPVDREARDAAIEAGAARSAAEHEADVESSAEHVLADLAALPADRRHVEVGATRGVTLPAHDIVWWRIREVAYHHVDLDVGHGFADLPGAVLDRGLTETVERFECFGGAPDLGLVATDAPWTGPARGRRGAGARLPGRPARLAHRPHRRRRPAGARPAARPAVLGVSAAVPA